MRWKKNLIFLKIHNNILDLGCAPGGWLQVAKKFGPKSAKIVGIDLLKIEKIDNVVSIEKDIFDEDIKEIIQKNFTNKVGLLMSDMSPNSSGNKKIDHLRIISLIERVLEISKRSSQTKRFFSF